MIPDQPTNAGLREHSAKPAQSESIPPVEGVIGNDQPAAKRRQPPRKPKAQVNRPGVKEAMDIDQPPKKPKAQANSLAAKEPTDGDQPAAKRRQPPKKPKAQVNPPAVEEPMEVDQPQATMTKRPRGQPAKPAKSVTAAEHSKDADATAHTDSEADLPARKKAKTAPTNTRSTGRVKTAATKPKPTPQSREPLPEREGRNTHPGLKEGVGANQRRSSAEVAAEREALRKQAEEEIRRGEEARRLVAEMDLAEEEQAARKDEESTQRLSARLLRGYYQRQEEEGEYFSVSGVEDSDEEVSEEEQPKVRCRSPARHPCLYFRCRSNLLDQRSLCVQTLRHLLRGCASALVVVKVKEQRESQRSERHMVSVTPNSSHDIRFQKSDLAPKKYKNGGFMASPVKASEYVGGLNDSDIDQERPNFPASPVKQPGRVPLPSKLKRDASRANKVCFNLSKY
jgi:hypothetical protein